MAFAEIFRLSWGGGGGKRLHLEMTLFRLQRGPARQLSDNVAPLD